MAAQYYHIGAICASLVPATERTIYPQIFTLRPKTNRSEKQQLAAACFHDVSGLARTKIDKNGTQ